MKFAVVASAVALSSTVSALVSSCQTAIATEGETCQSIADKHNVSADEIKNWNFGPSGECGLLIPGEKYCVTGSANKRNWFYKTKGLTGAKLALAERKAASARRAKKTTKKHGHAEKKHGHSEKKHGHSEKKHGHSEKKHGHDEKKHGHDEKKHGHAAPKKHAAAKKHTITKKHTTAKKHTTVKKHTTTTKKATHTTTTKSAAAATSTAGVTQSRPGDNWSSTPKSAPSNAVRHIISDCTKYATVDASTSWCGPFAEKYGITQAQLYSWNAGLHKSCDNLDDGKAYCVGV